MDDNLPLHIQQLIRDGISLQDRAMFLFDQWPFDQESRRIPYERVDGSFKGKIDELKTDIRRCFNMLSTQVIPYTVYSKDTLSTALQQVLEYVTYGGNIKNARDGFNDTMEWVQNVIRALPPSLDTPQPLYQPQQSKYTPNTAFIMMSMDPAMPELDDIRNAIKEVCSSFGIRAVRADDVEHQDKITDVVLQYITNSEFLIADMTGERPNVYYEVGFAHAINKRPILYRKNGTRLPFDLSVHNVPGYKNITELKELLTKRFEAILGKKRP